MQMITIRRKLDLKNYQWTDYKSWISILPVILKRAILNIVQTECNLMSSISRRNYPMFVPGCWRASSL